MPPVNAAELLIFFVMFYLFRAGCRPPTYPTEVTTLLVLRNPHQLARPQNTHLQFHKTEKESVTTPCILERCIYPELLKVKRRETKHSRRLEDNCDICTPGSNLANSKPSSQPQEQSV